MAKRLDDDDIRRVTESLRQSQEDIAGMAVLEVKALCIGHSVDIGHGTGESATQTIARAKDLYQSMKDWMVFDERRK